MRWTCIQQKQFAWFVMDFNPFYLRAQKDLGPKFYIWTYLRVPYYAKMMCLGVSEVFWGVSQGVSGQRDNWSRDPDVQDLVI